MRLCFAYTLATLLYIIPEWTITYNVHAKTVNTSSRIMRMIVKCLFGGGRGLIHALCFVLVFHGDTLLAMFKRLAVWLFTPCGGTSWKRRKRHRTGDSETGGSSTILVEEQSVESLDYDIDIDDLHRKTFEVGITSNYGLESQISIPPPLRIAKS